MQKTSHRRRAAIALLLATLTLAAAGCERRAGDPIVPSSTPGTTRPTTPSTSPSTLPSTSSTTSPGSMPDSAASAANR